jgi:hypothetical protein
METDDLISFDEVNELCDVTQPSHIHYCIVQALIETKNRVQLLEDRLAKLEKKNKETEQSFSMIPMNNPLQPLANEHFYFCDVNCREIKIDAGLYIFMDDSLLCNIYDFRLINYLYETNPSQRFLRQFKNIKTFIIDLSSSIIGSTNLNGQCKSRSTEILINVCNVLLSSNDCFEILFKCNSLYDYRDRIEKLFKDVFQKSIQYTKLTVEVKNNLIVNGSSASYQTQPYINDTKSHCIQNNIEFTSNIGL